MLALKLTEGSWQLCKRGSCIAPFASNERIQLLSPPNFRAAIIHHPTHCGSACTAASPVNAVQLVPHCLTLLLLLLHASFALYAGL
jgi:hypothetical protein